MKYGFLALLVIILKAKRVILIKSLKFKYAHKEYHMFMQYDNKFTNYLNKLLIMAPCKFLKAKLFYN